MTDERSEGDVMQGPLSGYRILDLSRVLSGPVSTALLADQGADVIKVEPPGGDIVRHMGMGRDGMTAGFLTANRGKRSIALDLKAPEAIAIVKKLAESSDVFVQNFRPGAIEGMGLGYDVIREINPKILYVSVSGFGETGPYAHKRVYDPVIQALCGLADIQGDREEGRPRMVRTVIPDKTTGLTVAQAITAGLLARERSGEGQSIKVAMLDTMITYLWPEGLAGLTVVGMEDQVQTGQLAQDLIFQTTDGYITTGAVSDAEWHDLCQALEHPEWEEDERFNTPSGRIRNIKPRLKMMGDVLITRSSAEWLARLEEHGVPCAPVLQRPEIIDHAQVIENEILHEFDQPGLGRVRQPRPAARFEKTPAAHSLTAPILGEHGREILTEAGYDDAAIQALVDAGTLRGSTDVG